MRIAWIGPMPNRDGGATGVGRMLLQELSEQGVEVDCYFPGKESDLPQECLQAQNLTVYCQASSWQWNRWYSRNNFLAFITGQIANLRCEIKLAKTLAIKHKDKPYDLVYQFSHIELHALRRYKKQLPPIVLHPSVHAAGELRWHRREAHLSKLSEPLLKRLCVRLLLMGRAYVQKRHIRDADYVLSLSKNFDQELRHDYHLNKSNEAYIVPNPIDVDGFHPIPGAGKFRLDERITLLFVSRISVRKGTEMIVELSHRLKDLADRVHLVVVGQHSLWSDYRGLLQQLDKNVATYLGKVSGAEMHELYNSVDALIQPSHYEPFGLTVGEALACGIPVITSDKVGAAEEVDNTCCRVFPAGDMDALEREVRGLYQELCSKERTKEMAELARSEAIRLYSNPIIVTGLITIFHKIVDIQARTKKQESRLHEQHKAAAQ